MDAARESNRAGGTTPDGTARLGRQERVDAPGRGDHVRYGECAEPAQQEHGETCAASPAPTSEDGTRAEGPGRPRVS